MTPEQAGRWDGIITRAERRGHFLKRDLKAAQSWRTCAVGEHQGQYREVTDAYSEKAQPFSNRLDKLGINFYCAVSNDEIPEARSIWKSIQTYFKNRKPLAA